MSDTAGLRLPAEATNRYTAGALAATVAGVLALVPHAPHAVSALLLILFVGAGPGCAVLAWVDSPGISRLLLVPALGLAAVVVITTVAALVGWWTPRGLFVIMALTIVWSTVPNIRGLVQDMLP